MMSRRVSLGADFGRRAATALIGAPVIIAIIVVGQPLWEVAVIAVALLCVRELQRMISPNTRMGLAGIIAITLASFVSFYLQQYGVLAIVILLFFLMQAVRSIPMGAERVPFLLRYFVYATLAALYVGVPLSLLLGVRSLPQGAAWTIVAFFSNWATDGLALIGGRLLGRRKLAPQISPGKTIEGAFIGLVGGFAIGMIAAKVLQLPLPMAAWVCLAVPIFTEVGDLLESWIKRYFAVKDAGTLLPGHGGLMDRVDGMLLAGPVLYLMLTLIR